MPVNTFTILNGFRAILSGARAAALKSHSSSSYATRDRLVYASMAHCNGKWPYIWQLDTALCHGRLRESVASAPVPEITSEYVNEKLD